MWRCASSTRSGPGAPQTSLPGRLAAELRRALERGTDVRLGSLDAVRDFVDARDVADAVLAAAAAPTLPHSVLNIGSGRGVPVRALVKELLAISGCTGTVHEDAPDLPRPQGIAWQQADISRAREDLGWAPQPRTVHIADRPVGGEPVSPRAADGTELVRPRLIVPAYFHPATHPGEWARLAERGGPGQADRPQPGQRAGDPA